MNPILLVGYSLAVAWEEHGRELMWIAGAVTALGVLGKAVLSVWRGVKKIMAFVDRVGAVVDVVEKELLSNNGGSTQKDKIEATHKAVVQIEQRLRRLEGDDTAEGHFLKGDRNVRHSQ